MDRRRFLGSAAGAAAGASFSPSAWAAGPGFKQGVCPTVFDPQTPFEDQIKLAARCGVQGYDFVVDPKDFAVVKRHGMQLSLLACEYGGAFALRPDNAPEGWAAAAHKEAQGEYLQATLRAIDAAAANGCPSIHLHCGSRDNLSESEGADNMVAFLDKAKSRAEQKGVVLCFEILNNKGQAKPSNPVFDHLSWGWDVCKRVNSKSVKVLYDIFQVQLDDGNIVQNIRDNIQWIGHFHTGGVPGRHEIWRNDELDYRFIAEAIAATGYRGFVSHEWHPSPGADLEECLRKSVDLMRL